LSISASSHGTSDLHSPQSTVDRRPPELTLWIPTSGTTHPNDKQRLLTGCRDGVYFDLTDKEDGEVGERAVSAPVTGADTIGGGAVCDEPNGSPAKVINDFSPELPLSMWIRNEVAGI
jgi:hypothetical protein